mmetsp:Transcript_164/g.384  ORF Transcript_164/g.384 Transcript_164/m.384 type:complete len:236 (-) Transcript_164:536-1243(-)
MHLQERQQQRQEDKRRLVKVASEGRGRRGEGVDDTKLHDVVHEGEHAREREKPEGLGGDHGDLTKNLPVGCMVHAEDLGPLPRNRLVEERSEWNQEHKGRDGHVRDCIVDIQFHLAENTCQRQVQGPAEKGQDANDGSQDHVAAGLSRSLRAHDLRNGERTGAAHTQRHEEDLTEAPRLQRIQPEHSEPLLRKEGGQRQAGADDEVHCDADVPQAEIVQRDVQREDAAEDADGKD